MAVSWKVYSPVTVIVANSSSDAASASSVDDDADVGGFDVEACSCVVAELFAGAFTDIKSTTTVVINQMS